MKYRSSLSVAAELGFVDAMPIYSATKLNRSLDYCCRMFCECATIFVVVKGRWLFLYGTLLLLLANGAYAGRYERTKDGTLVWNNLRGWGNEATWSGDRDPKRYAIGEGTLTWYRVERRILTGSNIPFARGSSVVVGSYSGKMVRGKFDGLVVNVDANEKTFHATFSDGRKVNDWAAGPAPSPGRTGIASDQRGDEQVQRNVVAKAEAEPPPPAEGPASVPQHPPLQDDGATRQANKPVSGAGARETPSQDIEDSLKSLIGPPSFLRMKARAEGSPKATIPPTVASSPTRPRLTKSEVIELADAEARTRDYDLGEYQRPQVQYAAADDTWAVSYDQKNDANGMGDAGKHFSVSVEDRTKKTSIVAGR